MSYRFQRARFGFGRWMNRVHDGLLARRGRGLDPADKDVTLEDLSRVYLAGITVEDAILAILTDGAMGLEDLEDAADVWIIGGGS